MKRVSRIEIVGVVGGLILVLGCRRQPAVVAPLAPVAPAVAVVPVSSVSWDVPDSMKKRIIREQGWGFKEKIVALTFDDGPSTNNTPVVLSTLDKHHIKATFFLVGVQMQAHPELVKEIINRGHVIGNHTFTHGWRPYKEMAEQEFDHWESLFKEITGRETRLFRPPFGRTKSAFSQVALERGYPLILWTNTGADTGTKNAEVVYKNVVENIRPGDIIILHDNRDKEHTVKALPRIIEALEKKGYGFTTVPELLTAWDKARAERKAKKEAKKKALEKSSTKQTPKGSKKPLPTSSDSGQ